MVLSINPSIYPKATSPEVKGPLWEVGVWTRPPLAGLVVINVIMLLRMDVRIYVMKRTVHLWNVLEPSRMLLNVTSPQSTKVANHGTIFGFIT